MIKSDCIQDSKVIVRQNCGMKTAAAGNEGREGVGGVIGLGADPVPRPSCKWRCKPCVQAMLLPSGGKYVRLRDPKKESFKNTCFELTLS